MTEQRKMKYEKNKKNQLNNRLQEKYTTKPRINNKQNVRKERGNEQVNAPTRRQMYRNNKNKKIKVK